VFLTAAAILLLGAAAVWVRFVVAYAQGHGSGHVQSLILGAVLFNAGVVVAALGVIGDLLSAQRTMIQRTHERVRRVELQLGIPPSHYESLTASAGSAGAASAGAGSAGAASASAGSAGAASAGAAPPPTARPPAPESADAPAPQSPDADAPLSAGRPDGLAQPLAATISDEADS
jgi:hypothetical protein